MRPFDVAGSSPQDFVARIREELVRTGYDRWISAAWTAPMLTIRFSYLGTSVLRFQLIPQCEGFTAEPAGNTVARTHRPFLPAFEDRLEEVLRSLGATPR